MLTIKMWLPFAAIIDTKEKGGKRYTNLDRIQMFADKNISSVSFRKEQKVAIYAYCAVLLIVAIITMIVIVINFTETKSYISVVVIWIVNLVLIFVIIIIVVTKIRNLNRKDSRIKPENTKTTTTTY
jgi:ABC-type multidrug transport system fused ATPase/permease subunit